jgi:hypothetical protein
MLAKPGTSLWPPLRVANLVFNVLRMASTLETSPVVRGLTIQAAGSQQVVELTHR